MGKPIIAYAIEAAFKTELFDRVIVSTEDSEIAEISANYGAEIDKRIPSLATDTATVLDVCVDFLMRGKSRGYEYDLLCALYATAPLRNVNDIRGVVNLVQPPECNFALAVTRYGQPPHQALKMLPDNALEPMWPELVNSQSDSIQRLCVDNGSTYAVSVPAFLEQRSFYGKALKGYEMPEERSVDCDTKKDLNFLNYLVAKEQK